MGKTYRQNDWHNKKVKRDKKFKKSKKFKELDGVHKKPIIPPTEFLDTIEEIDDDDITNI